MANMAMSKEKDVGKYVGSLAPGQRALVNKLRKLVRTEAPQLQEIMKWGNVCWTGVGNVCLIHAGDDHLDFAFFMGASLPDPDKILVGKGKFLRMVKIRKPADIHPRELSRVLASAVALDAGAARPKARR